MRSVGVNECWVTRYGSDTLILVVTSCNELYFQKCNEGVTFYASLLVTHLRPFSK